MKLDLLYSICTGSLKFCATTGDGDSHGFYLEERQEREWRSFHKTLEHFPHSFQLEDQQQLSVNTCRKVLRSLQADLEAGLPTPLETARALNLLAYLHFQLGRPREALEHTEQALQQEGEERNVVSLGNRAAMLWSTGVRSRAKEQVRDLENLRNDDDFGYLVVKARAELAFSYTCLGGNVSSEAVPIFKEVIAKAEEPEVWLWKFGLAFTERRLADMNRISILTFDGEDTRLLNVLRILLEVIENCRSQNLKAKAYSEVAHLLQGRRGSKSQAKFEQVAQLDPVKACNKALELDSNDSFVLWKCGRIFRYAKLLDTSCELLKKSVEQRPTTVVYHHLGLTYKALATRKKYSCQGDFNGRGRGQNQRGGPRGRCKGYSERGRGREERWKAAEKHEDGPERCGREGRMSNVNVITGRYQEVSTSSEETTQRDIRSFQRTVKSPSRDAVKFSRTDPFVQEAMDAFKKAVELSEGENIPAVYDLALMHRALVELKEALKLLDTIQQARLKSMGTFDKINAYEQAGLILKDMSEMESDEERRKKLNEEGEFKLNMALYLCSSLCSRLPGLQHFIRDVWHAFPTLLQAAQDSDRHHTDKLREKARLYQLIKDHWQSMVLLQEIRNIDPKAAESPDYLKMCIENYVSLEHYDKALAFIKTLKCTAQGSALDLFEDDQYVQKVYVLAGRAALLKATSADKSNEAREYFSTAFFDAHSTDSDGAISSEDAESVDDGGDDDSWDVMLLHEDSAEVKAKALSDVLQSACGLKVTRMEEDCLPGRPKLDSIMRIMSRSRQVVVLAGARQVTAELRLLLEKAARKPATVTLLVEGDHVPKMMRSTSQRRSGSRSMVCPEELLIQGADGGGGGAYSHTKVQAVCDVFSFLTDIPSVSPHQGASCL